jgi:hypothetical protein
VPWGSLLAGILGGDAREGWQARAFGGASLDTTRGAASSPAVAL